MSTGDGICSICGLPLGPSSNPRVKVCAGHGGTVAVNLAALNAAPDAGDVEARPPGIAEHLHLVALTEDAQYRQIVAERDALAAQVAQMRGALEEVMDTLVEDNGNHLPPDTTARAEAALALPATAAEERVLALERFWMADKQYRAAHNVFYTLQDDGPARRQAADACSDAEEEREAARNALRALDGKDGASDE